MSHLNVRLTEEEIEAIKSAVKQFDPDATIYLFGSRINLDFTGGDIDLLVLSKTINNAQKRHIKLNLYDTLGEQKIGLIISNDTNDPFVKIILNEGVKL